MKLIKIEEHYYLLDVKVEKPNWFVWVSGMTGRMEVHKFHSDAGYGMKTYTQYNEKDGSSELVNWSGYYGEIIASTESLDGLPKIYIPQLVELISQSTTDNQNKEFTLQQMKQAINLAYVIGGTGDTKYQDVEEEVLEHISESVEWDAEIEVDLAINAPKEYPQKYPSIKEIPKIADEYVNILKLKKCKDE